MSPWAAGWVDALRQASQVAAVRTAAVVWAGAASGASLEPAIAVGVAVALAALWLLVRRPSFVLVAAALAALLAGSAAAQRTEASAMVAAGHARFEASVIADPQATTDATDVLVAVGRGDDGVPPGAKLLVSAEVPPGVDVGGRVAVTGDVRATHGWFGRHRYVGTVLHAEWVEVASAGGLFALGNAVRAHVLGRVDAGSQPRALLQGFLVGETAALDASHVENMRRTGLSHFVAVSGSNVALVLGAWWLLAGVGRLGRRLRAALGLLVVATFAVVTRWEPSVVRASLMAAAALAAQIAGYPLTAWQALGAAATIALLVSPELATDVGLQLSAAATVGVMVATHMRRVSGVPMVLSIVASVFIVTLAAQIAVLPILLVRFGEAPLLSPLANVVAAPLVATSTVLAGIGALLGIGLAVDLASIPASGVLAVADLGAGWPQIDTRGVGLIVVAAGAWMRPRLRFAVIGAGMGVGLVWLLPATHASGPEVVFLDVGQGDAVLITDGLGSTALVDGGGDPESLRTALRRHGVTAVDLIVVSHGDADHVGGLVGSTRDLGPAVLAYPALQPESQLLRDVIGEAAASGAAVRQVQTGDRLALGGLSFAVVAPARRFATENDGSVVLWIDHGATSVLLTGDVEAVAQAELPELRPDVLQVPHHGSATTDTDWLVRTAGSLAVISVGPNRHGHPSDEIVSALRRSGVTLLTTWDDGDVIIPLDGRR